MRHRNRWTPRAVAALTFGVLGVVALPGAVPAQQPAAVKMAYSAQQQIPYAASLVAWQNLKGITVEPVYMRNSPQAVQTLLKGDVQMVQTNPVAAFKAILEGGPLTVLAGLMLNEWTIVSRAEIAEPRHLAGKQLAVHSESSMSYTVAKYFVKKEAIPNVRILFIAGSPNRAQALRSGQIDATTLYITDAVRLAMTDPGKFRVLADFSNMSEAMDSVLLVRKDWLAAHPREAREILTTLVQTHRWMAKHPAEAVERVARLFPKEKPEFVKAAVESYLEKGIWDADAALRPDLIRTVVDFLATETGDLPKDVNRDPAAYATFAPLDEVLAQLGRVGGK